MRNKTVLSCDHNKRDKFGWLMCRGCLDQTVLMHSLILTSAAQMGKLSIVRVMDEMIFATF